MTWLLAFFLFFGTNARADGFPSGLLRPFSPETNRAFPVTRLAVDGQYTEGYIYSDVAPGADRTQLANIVRYFDEKIYPRFNETFGDPRGHSRRQNKVVLLFDCLKNKAPAFHSRRLAKYGRDIILMDLDSVLNSNYVNYYLPHELQHIARFANNPNESNWLNEGLSKFAESYLNNQEFPTGYLDTYQTMIGANLLADSYLPTDGRNYFNSFFFVYYLYRHFGGIDLIRKLIASPLTGIANVNAALAGMRSTETNHSAQSFYSFDKAFVNYEIALLLNPYSGSLESGGFWDLKLGDDTDSAHAAFGLRPETLPHAKRLRLKPTESRYFEVDERCVNLGLPPTGRLLALLVDLGSGRTLKTVRPGQPACFESAKNSGHFLVFINVSATSDADVAIQ